MEHDTSHPAGDLRGGGELGGTQWATATAPALKVFDQPVTNGRSKGFYFHQQNKVLFFVFMNRVLGNGGRLRIDCAEFHRESAPETLENLILLIVRFLEKSLVHRMPPTWSLEASVGPTRILCGPQLLPR
jgi:hypothetical protein